MRKLTIISTGGTIEKTYDEMSGELSNRQSVVGTMLGLLRLEDTSVNTVQLLSKDSNDLTESDRERIVSQVRLIVGDRDSPTEFDGVVLLHGTDTLCQTGELLQAELGGAPHVPVVLTGAMRPFEMKESDALQNLNEALFAAGHFEGGVWVAAHGRALRFPGPTKDRVRGTFVMGD